MKKIIAKSVTPLVLFSCLMFLLSGCCTQKPLKVENYADISDVFDKIKSQYDIAKKRTDDLNTPADISKLLLKEADVTFDNVVTVTGGVSVAILIFKPSYTYTRKNETSVTYSLTNTNLPKLKMLATNKVHFNGDPNAISTLIYNVYKNFKDISFKVDGPLEADKDFEIDIVFSIDKTLGIDVTGTIGAFTPDLNISRDGTNTHTISLKFKIAKNS